MLTRGTTITWSGMHSPIPSDSNTDWHPVYINLIRTALSAMFSNLEFSIDPVTATSFGTETMHISGSTLDDYNSLDDAAHAITSAVSATGLGLDPSTVKYSANVIPFYQPSPVFQPPVRTSMMPQDNLFDATDAPLPRKGRTATRQGDNPVAPVITPIDVAPPINTGVVPPFLYIAPSITANDPSDYVTPINPIDSPSISPIDPYAYLPPVTPTQTTTPAPTVVAPVVTPVNQGNQTPTTTNPQTAPVVTSTDTAAAASDEGSGSGLLIGAAVVGGLLLFSGSKSKAK